MGTPGRSEGADLSGVGAAHARPHAVPVCAGRGGGGQREPTVREKEMRALRGWSSQLLMSVPC